MLVLTNGFNVSSKREIRQTGNVVKQANVASVIPQGRNDST